MISPLSVPTATVKLSAISKNIRNMPASRATVTITTNSMFIATKFCGSECINCELPRDRLNPGIHFPHSVPGCLLAHCASVPLKMLI